MTSTFAAIQAVSRATVHASTGVRALAVVASMKTCKVIVASRSPAQGSPAIH